MIKQRLQEDQIQALKNRDAEKLNILRYISSRIKNKEITLGGELSDQAVILILRKLKTEIKEIVSSAKKASRPDIVKQARYQLAVVSSYLPAELSDQELRKEINQIISDNAALYKKNPKAIIGICVKKLRTKTSASRIINILNLKT